MIGYLTKLLNGIHSALLSICKEHVMSQIMYMLIQVLVTTYVWLTIGNR